MKKINLPIWVLPACCFVVVVLLALIVVPLFSPSSDTSGPSDDIVATALPEIDAEHSIVSIQADVALAALAAPGDVVRLYDTNGADITALQYVQVYQSTEDGQLLLILDDVQASVFVSLSISDRVILVVHNDADQAKELLELQDRINNPQISLSLQPEATVTPGTELQLEFQADILPIEAPLPEIQWESSSPDIATVENGILHAQKVGTVTITAICGNAQANCSVSIEIPLQELRIDQEKVSLAVGEALQLTAIPVPEDATNFSAVWTSEDPGVAAVSNDGTVTGISPGTVSITASCGDILRQCTVTVGHHAEVVQLDRESLSLTIGQTYTLTPSIYPSTDLIDTMQFESSNAKVVQVNESGTVIALSVGKAYITFRCGEATTKCLVYVVASTP